VRRTQMWDRSSTKSMPCAGFVEGTRGSRSGVAPAARAAISRKSPIAESRSAAVTGTGARSTSMASTVSPRKSIRCSRYACPTPTTMPPSGCAAHQGAGANGVRSVEAAGPRNHREPREPPRLLHERAGVRVEAAVAPVPPVHDPERAVRIERHPGGVLEFAGATASPAERSQVRPVAAEHADL